VASICVHADPNRVQPIAIVVPAESTLSRFAAEKGLVPPGTSFESLVQNQDVVAAVHSEMLETGKRNGLARLELIQGLVLVTDEWSPENVCPITWRF
jgi:long-chain acyl-CoA synthetase